MGVVITDLKESAVLPTEVVPLEKLKPHPRNYRHHPEDQLEHIVQSIKTHGIYRPIVVAEDFTILAGHGVVLAARKLGLVEVPIVKLSISPDDPRALKLLTGDNEIANLGEVDDRALASILSQIRMEDDAGLLGTGFDDKLLADLILSAKVAEDEASEQAQYTSKIKVPTYQPSEEKPTVADLFDEGKTESLIATIEAAPNLTEEERHFLISAAQRHTVFHFNRIADFYAHAPQHVQALMEESALVIVDFDRAIELGFVTLMDKMADLREEEYGN